MIVIKTQHNSKQPDRQTYRDGRTEGRRLRPYPNRSMYSQSKSIALIRLGWRIPACLLNVGRRQQRRRKRDASHNENESGEGRRIVYVDGLLFDYIPCICAYTYVYYIHLGWPDTAQFHFLCTCTLTLNFCWDTQRATQLLHGPQRHNETCRHPDICI